MQNKTHVALILGALLLGNAAPARAADDGSQTVDQVAVEQGALIATLDGKSFVPTNTVALPFEIQVMTNRTFTVKEGAPRKLTEGQTLRKDGMLSSPDGSIVPVVDHVSRLGSKVVLVKDGKPSEIRSVLKLGNGAQIFADGTMISPQGTKTRLLDGQMFKLNGEVIPAKDTATLLKGEVVVQKDGALIKVGGKRTLMMNDGTKVFGDGHLEYSDGRTKELKEGETVELTGVRVRR